MHTDHNSHDANTLAQQWHQQLSRQLTDNPHKLAALINRLGKAESQQLTQHVADMQQQAPQTIAKQQIDQQLLEVGETITHIDPSQRRLDMSWWQRWLRLLLPGLPTPLSRWVDEFETGSQQLQPQLARLRGQGLFLQQQQQQLATWQQQLQISLQKVQDCVTALQLLVEQNDYAGVLPDHPERVDMQHDLQDDMQHGLQYGLQQRQLDLQQIIAVNQQAILSLQVLQQNNEQLLRAINLVSQSTMSALSTAALLINQQTQQQVSHHVARQVTAKTTTNTAAESSPPNNHHGFDNVTWQDVTEKFREARDKLQS